MLGVSERFFDILADFFDVSRMNHFSLDRSSSDSSLSMM